MAWSKTNDASDYESLEITHLEDALKSRAQEVRRCMIRGVDGTRCASGWITVDPPVDDRHLTHAVDRCECFRRFLSAAYDLRNAKKRARDNSPMPEVWLASKADPTEEMRPEDKAQLGRFMRAAIRNVGKSVEEVRAIAEEMS